MKPHRIDVATARCTVCDEPLTEIVEHDTRCNGGARVIPFPRKTPDAPAQT